MQLHDVPTVMLESGHLEPASVPEPVIDVLSVYVVAAKVAVTVQFAAP